MNSDETWPIQEGARGNPRRPKFLHFRTVSGKNCQTVGWRPKGLAPPLGNSGSATDEEASAGT